MKGPEQVQQVAGFEESNPFFSCERSDTRRSRQCSDIQLLAVFCCAYIDQGLEGI